MKKIISITESRFKIPFVYEKNKLDIDSDLIALFFDKLFDFLKMRLKK